MNLPRTIRKPWRAALAFAALALLVVAGGCAKAKGVLVPNVAPQTFLFVDGPVDTVNHRVHLYWYGSDPDGRVVAFDLRMFNSQLPTDTNWTRVAANANSGFDSLFTVFSPTGFENLRFEVRAVDNTGTVDASPAINTFALTNKAPIATIGAYPALNDSTFGSLTFSWIGDDPDGDGEQLRFRIWLDGNLANYDSTTGRTFTIPSARFLQNGTFASGYRTLYIQAVDDGGRTGPVDSTRWFVRAPASVLTGNKGRMLLIDDVPSTYNNNFTIDTLYSNTLTRNLPAGSFSILRLAVTQPFRSAADLEQTMKQFDAVVWYRADQDPYPPSGTPAGVQVLDNYEDAIGSYLDSGGRFFLECMKAVQGPATSLDNEVRGPLSENFMRRYLDSDSLRTHWDATLGDVTVTWGNANLGVFRSVVYADSLRASQLLAPRIRAFAVRDTNHVILWALPGTLTPANVERLPVAVMAPIPGGGKMGLTSYPLRFGSPTYSSLARLLAKILFHPTQGLMAP